jgi:hypothetical protein
MREKRTAQGMKVLDCSQRRSHGSLSELTVAPAVLFRILVEKLLQKMVSSMVSLLLRYFTDDVSIEPALHSQRQVDVS